MEIEEDSFRGKLSGKRIGERVLVARAGIKEAMCSKDTDREENIGDEKEVTRGGRKNRYRRDRVRHINSV